MNPAGRRTARTDSPIDTDALEMTDRTGEVDRTSHATVATAAAAGVLPPVTSMLAPSTVAPTAAAAAPADAYHREPSSPISSAFYTSSEPTSRMFMSPYTSSRIYQGTVVRPGSGIPQWKQSFFAFACAINKTDGNVSAIAPIDIDNILRMLPSPEAGDSIANNIRDCLEYAKALQDIIPKIENGDYAAIDTCDTLTDLFITTFLSCTTAHSLPGFHLTSEALLAARKEIMVPEAAGAASARPAYEPAAAFAEEE